MQNPPKNGGKQGPSAPVAVPSKKPDSENGSLIKPTAVDEGNTNVGINANVKVSTSTNGNIQIVRTSSAPPNIGEQEKAFGKQAIPSFIPAKMPQASSVSAQTKNTTNESTDKIPQNGSATTQPTVVPVTTSSMNPSANFQPVKQFNGPSTGVPPFNPSGRGPMNYGPRYQPYMVPSPYMNPYPMQPIMPNYYPYGANPMAPTNIPVQPQPVAVAPATPPAKKLSSPLTIINPNTNQEVKAPPSPAVQTPTPSTPGSGGMKPVPAFTPSPNKMFPEMTQPSPTPNVSTPMKATPPKGVLSPSGPLEIRKPEPLEIRKPEPLQIKKPEGALEIKKPEVAPKVEPKVEEKKPEEKKPEPAPAPAPTPAPKPEPVKVEGPLEIKKPEPKVEKKPEEKKPEPAPAPVEVKKPEPKVEEKKPEVKEAPKEEKPAEQKPEQKPETKPVQAETKPAEAPKPEKKEEPKSEFKMEIVEKDDKSEASDEEEVVLVRYPSASMYRPNNTTGALVYPKEFLKQFESLVGKLDHPDVEAIAKNHADDFRGDKKFKKGGYDSPGSGRGGAPPGFEGKQGGRRGGMGRGGAPRQPKKKEEKPVNPNRWESVKLSKKSLSGEEVIVRKFQNNLNKLADDNQESITAKILEIPVESADILAKFIKLIFDKAVSEKKFVNIYAELCKELSTKVPDFSTPEKKQSFRTLLLTRCQTEFETNFPRITGKGATATPTPTTTPAPVPAPAPAVVAATSGEGKKEDSSASAPTTPTTPTTTGPPALLTPEEIEFIHRSKMFGNIHFVGELYKNKMLTEKVMYSCIETLLGDVESPIADYMEALTKLLLVIGPILDQNQKSKPILDKFFVMITTCSRNKGIAPRVRFMLEDLIAARKSGWVVKHAIPASAPTQSASSLPTVSKTDGKKEAPKENPKKAQDFQTVKGGNVKTTQAKEIPKKSTTAENVNIASKNQFSLLSSSPTNADISLRPQGGFNKFASSSTKDKEAQAQKNPPKPKQNDEELGLKADQLLEELLGSGDVSEAVRCVKEDLTSAEYFYTFVSRCIVLTIEEDRPKDRVLMRDFLSNLLKQNIITQDHFQKAYESILETLEEMVVDFPKAPQLLAQILCTAVVDKLFDLGALKILENVDKGEKGVRPFYFVSSIFRQLLKEFQSEQKVVELYRKSGLDMMKFLQPENQNPDDLMDLLIDEGLRCLNP